MQAIIIAGGKGTRLKSLSKMVPKLLLPLNNKPLIEYLISHLKKNGCKNIVITTGYLGNKIREYVEKNNYGVKIHLSQEAKPLGTAGSLHLIKNLLEDEFFVLYGDVFTTIDLKKMFKFHKQRESDATLALHKSDHPEDSTVVKINNKSKILGLLEKPGENWKKHGNLTSTSLYILKKSILGFIEKNKEIDLTKDVFPGMLRKNKNLFGYITEEYAKDMGTPKRYKEVQKYVTIAER